VLVVAGLPASGKTHLAHIWAARSNAQFVRAEELSQQIAGTWMEDAEQRAWVVEDITALKDETALFHLLNAAREERGGILLTTSIPPSQMSIMLPDLRSRLCAAPLAILEAPDDEALAAVIIKQFSDRQLRVGEDVVQYLLKRMDRSYAAARDWVQRLDEAALAVQSKVTVALVRRLLPV
jgi:chromosomal replication initiation ATPase DnaA